MRTATGPLLVIIGLAMTVVLVLLLFVSLGTRTELEATRAELAALRAAVEETEPGVTVDELEQHLVDPRGRHPRLADRHRRRWRLRHLARDRRRRDRDSSSGLTRSSSGSRRSTRGSTRSARASRSARPLLHLVTPSPNERRPGTRSVATGATSADGTPLPSELVAQDATGLSRPRPIGRARPSAGPRPRRTTRPSPRTRPGSRTRR